MVNNEDQYTSYMHTYSIRIFGTNHPSDGFQLAVGLLQNQSRFQARQRLQERSHMTRGRCPVGCCHLWEILGHIIDYIDVYYSHRSHSISYIYIPRESNTCNVLGIPKKTCFFFFLNAFCIIIYNQIRHYAGKWILQDTWHVHNT